MLSQNQTGTISDEELGDVTVTLQDTFDDLMIFDVPLKDIEFYQITASEKKQSTPREKKPKTFWSDVPEDIKQELTNDTWLDQDG